MPDFSIGNIYSQHILIKRFFTGKVGSTEDIEELVQDVLYTAVKNISSLRNMEAFPGWIYGICRNRLKQYYEKKSRTSGSPAPEQPFRDRSYEKIELKLIIEKLPEQLRLLYSLYYEKNFKIREISTVLKMPEGTVKYLLYDLRQKVKDRL